MPVKKLFVIHGECTITQEGDALQLRLPVDGDAVTDVWTARWHQSDKLSST
ncbi:hypothetical protein PVK06_003299 [Gossypium arboreum]|uniref:Uncharacterized protein n=1 Tax=Gossypium arboreum TaxID=29729 RepID=A0ABR0R7D1_GOSAR|nr:hypothetical protein PVK06_003299 [Gossypium arboreum]